ncbi:MAG: LysR family transcriptional regulator [Trueperaceae bacterium]
MSRKLTLNQLSIFLTVVEQGNVTNAAAELEMSQSSVSHALAELEKALSVQLLQRGRFGAKPTLVGERVARQARMMLRLEQSILEEVSQETGELTGHLRLISFRSVATHLLPDIVKHFQALHPKVTFAIQSLEGEERGVERFVLEGRADIGVVTLPSHPALHTVPFAQDDWVAIFPKAKAPKAKGASWGNLTSLPFLLCNEAGAPTLRDYWEAHGHQLQKVAQVEEDSVIVSMVAHGFGISILARLAVEPVPPGLALRTLPTPLERHFAFALQPQQLSSPLVSRFLSTVTEESFLRECAVVRDGVVRLAS